MKTTKCIYDLCPCDKSVGDFSPECGHCLANSHQLTHLWGAEGVGLSLLLAMCPPGLRACTQGWISGHEKRRWLLLLHLCLPVPVIA